MKVRLWPTEWSIFGEYSYGIEVEVPKALITEHRQLLRRLDSITKDLAGYYWIAKDVAEKKAKDDAEARRDLIRARTRVRQQATPRTIITEDARRISSELRESLMQQYAMPLNFQTPRGIVYPDSPLRKKDDAD